MPDTATDAILLVLRNSQVKSEHSHEMIARQILAMFASWDVRIETPEDRKREQDALAAKPRKREPIEMLKYRIEVRTQGDDVLEVLGREHLVVPARSAYEAYRALYSDQLLMLLEGGGRVIARSDRGD